MENKTERIQGKGVHYGLILKIVYMRNIVLIAWVMLSSVLFSQKTTEIQVKSKVSKVKLFLTAGEMGHQAEVKLNAGRNKLIFSGISAFADPQSIQFFAESTYRLISVSTEMDFEAAEMFNPKIALLKDSLEKWKDLLQLNKDIQNSFQAELAVMNTNRDLKGNNQNLSILQIKEAASYYRTRTLEINKEISKLNKEAIQIQAFLENIRFQLTELNFNENQRSNQVIVLIDVEQAQRFTCQLSYLVSDCGWAATYDLSASDLSQKINLKYKAKVYNNTGNSWENVDLVLSTADPRLSASQPILEPWFLSYYGGKSNLKSKSEYVPQIYQQDYRSEVSENLNMANQRAYDNYMLDKDERGLIQGRTMDFERKNLEEKKIQKPTIGMKQIEISELTTEFSIATKFSCPSDSKPYIVEIKEMNLDALFTHVTVPKLDNGTFLLANIVGWQELDLIPGPTNVYFSGAYVGVSNISTHNVNDTLSLSFGRDNKVTVLRKMKQEVSSKKIIGGMRKETYLYEVSVRNNRQIPIKITIYDQIPISKNSEISVSSDELSGGIRDLETGEVKWELVLQAGETKALELGYTVKYPKDASVSVQRFRTISAPSF